MAARVVSKKVSYLTDEEKSDLEIISEKIHKSNDPNAKARLKNFAKIAEKVYED